MKLWKRWTAAVLAAAMCLLLLAACGPSGPSAPDQPDTPGTEQPGKDPDTGKEDPKDPDKKDPAAQQAAATVAALNTVRKEYGLGELVLNAQASAIAQEMAQVQMDGVNGKYGAEPTTDATYTHLCQTLRDKTVNEKACVGFGALQGAYPDAAQFRKWAAKTTGTSAARNNALVKSEQTTLVGVGVVPNPDTTSPHKYMVVVMTY